MSTPSLLARATAAVLLIFALPAWAANTCSFKSNGGLSLSFGALDPSNATDVTATVAAGTANANRAGHCNNLTMTISGDNGLYFSGTRRLRNGTSYIGYTLALPINLSAPGNNQYTTFSFTGTIPGSAYLNAPAGNYTDTVIITVSP